MTLNEAMTAYAVSPTEANKMAIVDAVAPELRAQIKDMAACIAKQQASLVAAKRELDAAMVLAAAQPMARPTVRKAYICTACDGVYADEKVTQCDCMPAKQEFTEGTITYPSAQPIAPAADDDIERVACKLGLIGIVGDNPAYEQKLIKLVRHFAPAADDERAELAHLSAAPVSQQPPAAAPAPIQSAELAAALDALRFYAEGQHFVLHDADVFDTVSGEPQNWQEDESNTIMFEDGSVAKLALDALLVALASPAAAPKQASSEPTYIKDADQQGGLCAAILAAMYKAFQRGDSVERAHAAVMAVLQQEQAKPTDLQAGDITDAEIDEHLRSCGVKWDGSVWVIEDADLYPMVRSFLFGATPAQEG
jgi:hypothetical protein